MLLIHCSRAGARGGTETLYCLLSPIAITYSQDSTNLWLHCSTQALIKTDASAHTRLAWALLYSSISCRKHAIPQTKGNFLLASKDTSQFIKPISSGCPEQKEEERSV